MSEPRKTSAELQHELDAKMKEAKDVKKQIVIMEEKLEILKNRIGKLTGGMWNPDGGEINNLTKKIVAAKLWESHSDCPAVVFYNGKPAFSNNNDLVVHKVTAKQIQICYRGKCQTDRFNLDGTSVSTWNERQIDIRKTFGIDADRVPPNFKFKRKESNE